MEINLISIFITILIFPYVILFILKGLLLALKEYKKIAVYLRIFIFSPSLTPGLEVDRIVDRKNQELDKIEKKETGTVTRPKGSATWLDSPTPEEEAKEADRQLLEDQRKLKEGLIKKEN